MKKELEGLIEKALRMEPKYVVDLEAELISKERIMYVDKTVTIERIDKEE